MIEFGKTLRAAREERGLSISQIADSTHMMSAIVDDLEHENFSRIAAPIYGRGFVKLYCQAVGIDYKPLVDEFMAMYNGDRDTPIRERTPASLPDPLPEPPAPTLAPPREMRRVQAQSPAPLPTPPPPAPEPEPFETVPPAPQEPFCEQTAENDLFSFQRTVSNQTPRTSRFAEPTPRPAASVTSVAPVESVESVEPFAQSTPTVTADAAEQQDEPQPAAKPALSRYASPLHEFDRSKFTLPKMPSLPHNFWRIILLTVVAIGFCGLIVIGVRALYRATSTRPATPSQAETATTTPAAPIEQQKSPKPVSPAKPTAPSAAPTAPRTPQKIPPLYIS